MIVLNFWSIVEDLIPTVLGENDISLNGIYNKEFIETGILNAISIDDKVVRSVGGTLYKLRSPSLVTQDKFPNYLQYISDKLNEKYKNHYYVDSNYDIVKGTHIDYHSYDSKESALNHAVSMLYNLIQELDKSMKRALDEKAIVKQKLNSYIKNELTDGF